MTNWRALETALDRKIGALFGGSVRHHPMKSGAVDPDRPVQALQGILHTPSPEGTINLGNGMVTTFAASEGALVVERALHPDVIFRKGDKVIDLELAGQPRWEVKSVNDRFTSILIVTLNQN